MTPENFIYWFNGYMELNGERPSEQQWQVIKDHLALVSEKKTPSISIPNTWPHTTISPLTDTRVTC